MSNDGKQEAMQHNDRFIIIKRIDENIFKLSNQVIPYVTTSPREKRPEVYFDLEDKLLQRESFVDKERLSLLIKKAATLAYLYQARDSSYHKYKSRALDLAEQNAPLSEIFKALLGAVPLKEPLRGQILDEIQEMEGLIQRAA